MTLQVRKSPELGVLKTAYEAQFIFRAPKSMIDIARWACNRLLFDRQNA
jgi:hypothetical protein